MKEFRRISILMFGGSIIAPILTLTLVNNVHWAQTIIPCIAVVLFVCSFVNWKKVSVYLENTVWVHKTKHSFFINFFCFAVSFSWDRIWHWHIGMENWCYGRKSFGIAFPFIHVWYVLPQFKKAIAYLTPYWVRYYQIQKEAIQADWSNACICSDPMNGCPEDFAEDHQRKMRGVDHQLYYLSRKSWKFGKKISNILLDRLNEKLKAQYNNLPWNENE